MANSSDTTTDREIVISRVFDAPRELVWKVWTEPEQVGMLQRVIIQAKPDPQLRERVVNLINDDLLESVLEREPTLEEAYLSILG